MELHEQLMEAACQTSLASCQFSTVPSAIRLQKYMNKMSQAYQLLATSV